MTKERLRTDSEAQRWHDKGLDEVSKGMYTEAHKSFAGARSTLETAVKTRKHGLLSLDEISVQMAHIVRDDGFTYVREAAVASDHELLKQGYDQLDESLDITHILVGGMRTTLETSPESLTAKQREILAEHGATLSFMGRIATVDTLMSQAQGEEPIDDIWDYYQNADSFLHYGNNGYYRVSNSMVAARHERLNDNGGGVERWLGRAAKGLLWTGLHDQGNLKAATLTAGSRARHLRSHQAAEASVFAKP